MEHQRHQRYLLTSKQLKDVPLTSTDANGNVTTKTNARSIETNYSVSGDLETVKSKKNANFGFFDYAKNFTLNAAGAVTSMQLGNGRWESTAFNSRLQPTQIAL